MMRVVMTVGMIVGAYVAGMNGITHVEVMEMVESSMIYVEGMIEYAESYSGEISSVVESVNEVVEGVL